DPLRYRRDPFDTLLRNGPLLFPDTGDTMAPGPVAALESISGLNQPDPETPPPQLKWHWSVDGPRHRVIPLHTRTRPTFRSRSRPRASVRARARGARLPGPVRSRWPGGMAVLVVIPQTPVAMPAVACAVIVPLMGAMGEFKARTRWRNLTGLEPDSEMWPGDEAALEAVLKRLAAYKRVVVLSGEVHWGSSVQLTYWTRGPRRRALEPAARAAPRSPAA